MTCTWNIAGNSQKELTKSRNGLFSRLWKIQELKSGDFTFLRDFFDGATHFNGGWTLLELKEFPRQRSVFVVGGDPLRLELSNSRYSAQNQHNG